jgi:hypothetical protein
VNTSINPLFRATLDFYPWTVDWRDVTEILVGGALTILGLYLWLRAGRDHKKIPPDAAEPPIHSYAGVIESAHGRTPVFLLFWYTFLGFWAVGYLVHIVLHGLMY